MGYLLLVREQWFWGVRPLIAIGILHSTVSFVPLSFRPRFRLSVQFDLSIYPSVFNLHKFTFSTYIYIQVA